MRLMYILPLGLSLVACASSPEPAAEAVEPPNPEILKRIEVRLEENEGKAAPDFHDVPEKGPALPSKFDLAEERAKLLAEQAALKGEVESDRQEGDEDELARKAEELKARVEKDRALMKAEGLLSQGTVRPPSRSATTADEK